MGKVKPTPEQVQAAMRIYSGHLGILPEQEHYECGLWTLDRWVVVKWRGVPRVIRPYVTPEIVASWATVTHDSEGQAEAARTVLRLFQGATTSQTPQDAPECP